MELNLQEFIEVEGFFSNNPDWQVSAIINVENWWEIYIPIYIGIVKFTVYNYSDADPDTVDLRLGTEPKILFCKFTSNEDGFQIKILMGNTGNNAVITIDKEDESLL